MKDQDRKIREVMSLLGKSKSEKKLKALAENRKATLFKPKKLNEIACNCGGKKLDHKSTCPRGRAVRYRQKHGLPLV